MQTISSDLIEQDNGAEVMRVLVNSLAEFLSEEEMAGQMNAEEKLLVDILSNNVVWVAKNSIEREKAQSILAAKEQNLQNVHHALLKKNMELRERSMIDDLTGLFNRRYFERSLSYDLERFKRYERPIGIILFDIDRFKNINDTYGHSVGDAALQHLSDLAKRMIRSADILARYGGEEFMLLLPETNLEGAKITAERLRAFVEEMPFNSSKGPIHMTISCGVTAVEGNFRGNVDDVIGKVDTALYRAKDMGRNTVVVL